MDLAKPNEFNVSLFLSEDGFVIATINQINKDLQGLIFEEVSIKISDSENRLFEIVKSLQPILLNLNKQQPEQLSQFIYRVDLNESKYFESLQFDAALENLAHLIIEREALKVYLRKRFSS